MAMNTTLNLSRLIRPKQVGNIDILTSWNRGKHVRQFIGGVLISLQLTISDSGGNRAAALG